jgi:hypothetical protein
MGMGLIAPDNPWQQLRKVLGAFVHNRLPRDCVERIFHVYFQYHKVILGPVVFYDCAHGVHDALDTSWAGNAELMRSQLALGFIDCQFADAFACEASQDLSHSDRSDVELGGVLV